MPLSSIANIHLAANQANKQHSDPAAAEHSEKGRGVLFSAPQVHGFSDNVTLTEIVGGPASQKTAGSDTLDPHAAGTLLKQITQAVIKDSNTALSAQANMTPDHAQILLAD